MSKKPKYKSAAAYQFSTLRRYPGLTLVSVILALLSALLSTIPSILTGEAVDVLKALAPTGAPLSLDFVTLIWMIIGYGTIYFFLTLVSGYLFGLIVLRWERDARQELFEDLQDKSMTFHDDIDSNRLLSIAMQDVQWVRASLNPALRQLITALGSVIITSILLALIDPMFGWIMLIGTPLYLLFSIRYANSVEPIRRDRALQMEKLTAASQEAFRGIEVVKAFGSENREVNKFQERSDMYRELNLREGRLAAFYLPALILILMTSISFLYGSYQVQGGILSVGRLTQIIALLLAVDAFNFMVPRFLLILRGGYVNSKRIVDLLNWKDPMTEPEHPITDVDFTGDIVFHNVGFHYNNSQNHQHPDVLKNINLRIPAGSRVALIGGPGSGKSTLLKLLMRFYDPTSGEIQVGGVNLRNVHSKTVRENVGLVEQDIFLFRQTISENIAYGCKTPCKQEEIIEVAKRAQANEFIQKLPKGYDTQIGERGMTLSGGQRQRLGIARTLMQDPKILLLDDSASAIDSQTEYYLRLALNEVMKNRTSITVTQRLRTLLESDMIIILDRGELVGVGKHEELLGTSKHYQRIFERLPGAEKLLTTSIRAGGDS